MNEVPTLVWVMLALGFGAEALMFLTITGIDKKIRNWINTKNQQTKEASKEMKLLLVASFLLVTTWSIPYYSFPFELLAYYCIYSAILEITGKEGFPNMWKLFVLVIIAVTVGYISLQWYSTEWMRNADKIGEATDHIADAIIKILKFLIDEGIIRKGGVWA